MFDYHVYNILHKSHIYLIMKLVDGNMFIYVNYKALDSLSPAFLLTLKLLKKSK